MEYFPHGGPGYILSAGLFQNVTLEVMEACLAEGVTLEDPCLREAALSEAPVVSGNPADGLPPVCADGRDLHSCLWKASHIPPVPSTPLIVYLATIHPIGTHSAQLGVISCPHSKLLLLIPSRWVWASPIQTRSGILRGSPSLTRCPPPS